MVKCVSLRCPNELKQTIELAKVSELVVYWVLVGMNVDLSRSGFLCSLFAFYFLDHDKFLDICPKSHLGFDDDTYIHGVDTETFEWLDNDNRTASTRQLLGTLSRCGRNSPSRINLPWMTLPDAFRHLNVYHHTLGHATKHRPHYLMTVSQHHISPSALCPGTLYNVAHSNFLVSSRYLSAHMHVI